ncbi:MAG: hypothetical protein WBA93_16745 [Microcoleaceae cyanobacterium]
MNHRGLIILDDSNWYVNTKFLRESDLIQVDMSGFILIGWEIQVSSFFFHP